MVLPGGCNLSAEMKYSGMHGTIRKHFNSGMRRDYTSTAWSTDPKELPEEAKDAFLKILA